MISPNVVLTIRRKYQAINPDLNECSRRHWAASEAMVLGHGGISAVSNATGIAISTIRIGLSELKEAKPSTTRIRREGGGRKKLTAHDPEVIKDLQSVIEPYTMGNPESPLLWTSKSMRIIANKLKEQNHKISHTKVGQLLHELGYSLQVNKKTLEGTSHPDRNAQFEFINKDVKAQQQAKEPVISVDTKKKELVGDFKNNGRVWRPKGTPEEVRVHDFKIPELGKVVPYGIYDIDRNHGWVNLGIDSNTAEFAVESIRRWWNTIGRKAYPHATSITITADSGGSNSPRARLWKYELQRLSNETGLTLRVRHFPPGTSKWNKIEHRLFSFISQNWRGKPLLTHATIINLIAATTTTTGLKVDCILDTNKYPTGKKISDEDYATINLQPENFHGEWNYLIKPNEK